MSATAIQAILALISQVLPQINSSSAIGAAIGVLEAWLPTIVTFYKAEVPVVKNLLGLLASKDDALPEQIAKCEELSAQCDASFDDALAKARAADAAR